MSQPSIPPSVYRLRVVLRGISPLIWRRLLVRSETTLAHLHDILQMVFHWSDEHLHSFQIHGREYGSRGAQTCRVLLSDWCLHRGERFGYVYDYGAHWACDIRLEAILLPVPRRVYPVCLAGKHAAPPEDCWGAGAYMERLEPHRLYPIWPKNRNALILRMLQAHHHLPLWLVLSFVVWVPTGLLVTKAGMSPLPEPRDGVRRELRLVSHQGQTFLMGLGDKEAVEGIPMVQGKAV